MAYPKWYTNLMEKLKGPTKPVESTPITDAKLDPAYVEAKKHNGKKETNKVFSTYVSKFWPFVGLKSYLSKGIAGASLAWCAVFFFGMNKEVGQGDMVKPSALAREIGKSGYEVDWRKDGIAQSMGVWKNSSDCNSSSGNHIMWADGDCSPEDLAKPGATIAGYGGNQSDQAKTSIYCVKGDCKNSKDKICRVFVTDKKFMRKVTKSKNCSTGELVKESTR